MAKREPCDYPSAWNSGFLGDCGQHLVVGESPVISGIQIVYGGGAYQYPPVAMIDPNNRGGAISTGFYGFGRLDKAGHVIGLDIVSSGWHFTSSPNIIFSGVFITGINGSRTACADKAWNDPACMCSGLGLIKGYPIYENVTLLPPQCSPVYTGVNWPLELDSLPICSEANLVNIGTNHLGSCLAGDEARCKTSWGSGWHGDCDNGPYAKTSNYCQEKGDRAPRGRCIGDWNYGWVSPACSPEIPQQWRETDQYLDFGVCRKRGYKNVVAMKSWHGQPPFPITNNGMGILNYCGDCASGEQAFNYKFLDARGIYTYNATWSWHGEHCPQCPGDDTPTPAPSDRFGFINNYITTFSTVGRKTGKINVTSSSTFNSRNMGEYASGSIGFAGFDYCAPGGPNIHGFPFSDPATANAAPYNYSTFEPGEYGGGNSETVRTSAGYLFDRYWYVQEKTISNVLVVCCTCPEDVEGCRRLITKHHFKFHSLETVAVQMGNQYTYSALQDDVDGLLNQWDLLNDVEYPWKTNEGEFVMPKVTHCEAGPQTPYGSNEITGPICPTKKFCNFSFVCPYGTIKWNDCEDRPPWPELPDDLQGQETNCDMYVSCSWTTGVVFNDMFDGHIMGAPAPTGYFGTVNFSHTNYEDKCCSCECDTMNNILTRSYGAVSPLNHLTQWPNEREKNLLYPGAFTSINDWSSSAYACTVGNNNPYPWIGQDILVQAKYAEIIQLDKPSRNTRMPCGIGSSVERTLQNESDSYLNSYANANYKTQCSQTCDNCHDVIVDDGGGVTRNCRCCDGQNADKLRWSYFSGKPYVCGNSADIVSGSLSTNVGTLVLNASYTGTTGDYINVFLSIDGGASTQMGTYKLQGKPSASGLVISGTFIETNQVGGWVDFPNQNDWFDNNPKGDFVVRKWDVPTVAGTWPSTVRSDPTMTVSTTQYCLPWRSCDPSIVVITSKNGREYDDKHGRNALVIKMPDLVPKPCGARFHYIPQQWMPDPSWNRPSKPCCLESGCDKSNCQPKQDEVYATDINHVWTEDAGDCKGVEVEYRYGFSSMSATYVHHYPMRPFIEARLDLADSPYNFPVGNCNIVQNKLTSVMGCFNNTQLDALTEAEYNALMDYYGGATCAICSPPTPNTSYWGIHAPWLVAANQEACIREADAQE